MPLTYRGRPSWEDMSEFAVHFVGKSPDDGYDTIMRILAQGRLVAGRAFGAARHVAGLECRQESVCLSEVPLDRLGRLIQRRGRYGLGFHQGMVLRKGGSRVWYVAKGSREHQAVKQLVATAQGPPLDQHHPVWPLARFIDFPGDYGSTQYQFEWEREWRVPVELRFSPDEVSFLFVPEHQHEDARLFFEQAGAAGLGPAYRCPLLDPTWTRDRISAALQGES